MTLIPILLLIALIGYIGLILYNRTSLDLPAIGLAIIGAILMFMR